MSAACALQHRKHAFAAPASQLSESTPLLISPAPKRSDVGFNLLRAKKKKPVGDEYTTTTSGQSTAHHRAVVRDSQRSDSGQSQSNSGIIPTKDTPRKIAGGDGDGSGDGDDDDGDPNNSRKASAVDRSERSLWACPFGKRYENNKCSAVGICTIPLVKNHLVQSHAPSNSPHEHNQCSRCLQVFEGKLDLGNHQRKPQVCSICPFDQQQLLMSQSQMSRVQDIPPRIPGYETDEERWFKLWKVVFPGVEVPSSPYINIPTVLGQKRQPEEEPSDFESSLPSSPDTRDLEPEVPDTGQLERVPDLFQALEGVEPNLWHPSALTPRRDLWDAVVSAVRATLLSSKPQTQQSVGSNACCKDTETALGGGGSSTAVGPSSNQLESGTLNKPHHPNRKRRRDDGDEKDGDDSDGEEPVRPRKEVKEFDPTAMPFGCPFRKMFPWVFIHKTHCLGAWPNVSRLKEHLYRQHIEPDRCNRCYEPFGDVNQLIQHQRSNPPCKVIARPPTRGIDSNQLRLLKVKKRGGSEYEKCRRVYKILWPDISDDDLPCPYWDTASSKPKKEPSAAEFHAFLQQELSPFLQHRLDATFPADQTVSKSEVVVVVEDALRELYKRLCSGSRPADSGSRVRGPTDGPGLDDGGMQELDEATDDGVSQAQSMNEHAVFGDLQQGVEFGEAEGTFLEWFDNSSWAQLLGGNQTLGIDMNAGEIGGVWSSGPNLAVPG